MGIFKKQVKNFMGNLTGYEIERIGSKSFAVPSYSEWVKV